MPVDNPSPDFQPEIDELKKRLAVVEKILGPNGDALQDAFMKRLVQSGEDDMQRHGTIPPRR